MLHPSLGWKCYSNVLASIQLSLSRIFLKIDDLLIDRLSVQHIMFKTSKLNWFRFLLSTCSNVSSQFIPPQCIFKNSKVQKTNKPWNLRCFAVVNISYFNAHFTFNDSIDETIHVIPNKYSKITITIKVQYKLFRHALFFILVGWGWKTLYELVSFVLSCTKWNGQKAYIYQ